MPPPASARKNGSCAKALSSWPAKRAKSEGLSLMSRLSGKKRRIYAALNNQLFQRADVRGSRIRSALAVFVLQLNADDWSILIPVQTLQLIADFAVEPSPIRQVGRIVPAYL